MMHDIWSNIDLVLERKYRIGTEHFFVRVRADLRVVKALNNVFFLRTFCVFYSKGKNIYRKTDFQGNKTYLKTDQTMKNVMPVSQRVDVFCMSSQMVVHVIDNLIAL